MGRPKSDRREKIIAFLRALFEQDPNARVEFVAIGDALGMTARERCTGQLSSMLHNMVLDGSVNREGSRCRYRYWLGSLAPLPIAERQERVRAARERMSADVALAIRTPLEPPQTPGEVAAAIAGSREAPPFQPLKMPPGWDDVMRRVREAREAAPSKGEEA